MPGTTLIVAFALYPVVGCLLACAWLLHGSRRGMPGWALRALAAGAVVAFVVLAGPWALTSIHFRWVAIGVFFGVAWLSYRRATRMVGEPGRGTSAPLISVAMLLVFSGLNGLVVASRYTTAPTVEILLPFRSGKFYVIQGGNSVVTNPFHALSGSRLALDIVKLGDRGNRASGIAPREAASYAIHGEVVYSPCEGLVMSVRDGLSDNVPGNPDPDHPKGNHVVLDCSGVEVSLGHLMQGSIVLAPGEVVKAGQRIGRVGNSGNTLEPHLHLSAQKSGQQIGLSIDGLLPTVNSIILPRR